MAAKKKTTKKQTGRGSASAAMARLEAELPPNLRDFSRQVRRDLTRLERRIDVASRDARRQMTRLLRDVSHELGKLEAEGQKRWRALTHQARRDLAKQLNKLQKAIEPPKKRAPRKKASKA